MTTRQGSVESGKPKAAAFLDAEQIIHALKQELANFKVPKRVFFTGDLPRNTMGKVQKNLVRDQYKDLFAPTPER